MTQVIWDRGNSGLGVHAADPELKALPKSDMLRSKTGKSLMTCNQTGFDTQSQKTTWVIDQLLDRLDQGDWMLDIGCGYGATTHRAIDKGFNVVANDNCVDHLLWCQNDTPYDDRDRLHLKHGGFPDLTLPENQFDAVLAHRIFHFLGGDEIDRGLTAIHKWLKPGGLLGIAVMSASHAAFRSWFFPRYAEARDAGACWPGEWLSVAEGLPEQAYALPDRLHVIEPEELSKAVVRAGFEVIDCDYVSMQGFGSEPNRDGKEHAGVLARMPSR